MASTPFPVDKIKPSKYAALVMDRFPTGLWTQRSPLRDAATPYLYVKFYSGTRFDSLLAGSNVEISNRLTLVRRPGNSVYNSQTFSTINRFYEFRTITNSFGTAVESIHVMADTSSTVYDATGPSTKTAIFTKPAGAGKSTFVQVGNTLYQGDGVGNQAWTTTPTQWAATTSFPLGAVITDSNGNLQVATASVVMPLVNVGVSSNVLTVSQVAAFNLLQLSTFVGMTVSFANVATATFLNGQTVTILTATNVSGHGTITASFVHANYGPTADTGLVESSINPGGTGPGPGQPTWATTAGQTTLDNNLIWTCAGPAVHKWGIAAPINKPVLAGPSSTLSSGLRFWAPLTAFGGKYNIIDPNGNLQVAILSGGTSGAIQPKWNTSVPYSVTVDGSVTWQNFGPLTGKWLPSTFLAGGFGAFLDTNGNIQFITTVSTGISGSSQPSWNATVGGTTTDGGITWTNLGSGQQAIFKGYGYVYTYENIGTFDESTASPAASITTAAIGAGLSETITGQSSSDPQVANVNIYRTADGGSTYLFLASVTNTAGSPWTFTDTLPDSSLNFEISAPINHANDPPPAGFLPMAYHLNRIWGAVGNAVMYTPAPGAGVGNSYSQFPPANNFVFPSKNTNMVPSALGLIVFTTSGLQLITGNGAPSLIAQPFLPGKITGLLSYDALAVNGSIMHLMTSSSKFMTIDPSSGISEDGFPIGDVLKAYNPANAFVTWHEGDSTDSAAYVTDGSANWYRLNRTPAPETGVTWSPQATIIGGFSAVQSIETSPGVHNLLLGPATSGPILKRDSSTHQDNGSSYLATATIGAIILAHPGQVALVDFLTTDCTAVGSRPAPAVLLGEISGTFENLVQGPPDPTDLLPSVTVYNDRWYFSTTQEPAECRYLQLQINWPAENFGNELLAYALNGAVGD